MGLANLVADDPEAEARKLLQNILSNGPLAIRNAIQAVYHSGTKRGFQLEADMFGNLCTTDDAKEGTAAFLEKRTPDFKGS